MRATRLYVVGFAIVTALVALRPLGGIVELTSFSGALYGACFLPAIVLGLHWRRGNGASVIASFVVGVVVLVGWRFSPWSGAVHQVFPAIGLSILVYLVVARYGAPVSSSRVARLFTSSQGL